MSDTVTIRPAAEHEVSVVLAFIRELARYERLEHEVVATVEDLRAALFGSHRYAEVVFACSGAQPVGFALFFHNFSTFLGRPGIYLEDRSLGAVPLEEWRTFRLTGAPLAQLARDEPQGPISTVVS